MFEINIRRTQILQNLTKVLGTELVYPYPTLKNPDYPGRGMMPASRGLHCASTFTPLPTRWEHRMKILSFLPKSRCKRVTHQSDSKFHPMLENRKKLTHQNGEKQKK